VTEAIAMPVVPAGLAWLPGAIRGRRFRRVAGIGLFLVAAAIVGGILLNNADQLRAAPWRLDVAKLAAGLLLQAATLAIGSWIWTDVSAAFGAATDRRRDARVYAYSLLAKRLPGAFWHVLGRAAYYGEVGLARQVGVAGSLAEMGLLMVTGSAIALAAVEELRPLGPFGALGLLVGGPYLVRVVVRRVAGHAVPRLGLGRLWRWTALDLAAWLIGCAGVFLQMDALYPVSPSVWPRVVAAATGSVVLSSLVLVLPAGLGLKELSFVGLLGAAVPAGVAAALAIGLRLSTAIVDVVWALAVIVVLRPRPAEAIGD
jgi:hypothetical protein